MLLFPLILTLLSVLSKHPWVFNFIASVLYFHMLSPCFFSINACFDFIYFVIALWISFHLLSHTDLKWRRADILLCSHTWEYALFPLQV